MGVLTPGVAAVYTKGDPQYSVPGIKIGSIAVRFIFQFVQDTIPYMPSGALGLNYTFKISNQYWRPNTGQTTGAVLESIPGTQNRGKFEGNLINESGKIAGQGQGTDWKTIGIAER